MFPSCLRSRAFVFVLAICALACLPLRAHALGFELTPPGAREAGRAGASVAGADSALGLFYNPATTLKQHSLTDTAAALHIGFTDVCFTRTEVNEGASGARSAGDTLPTVCSDAKVAIIPAVASTLRLGTKQRFALSLGFYAPPAVGRNIAYGDPITGTIDGSTDASALTPSRYLLMQENIMLSFPTVGFAWQPHDKIRLGASFGWGIATFDFTTASYSRTEAALGVVAESDVSTKIKGQDNFVPRVQVGIWTELVQSLELAASFTWTQDVRTTSADLALRNLHTDYSGSPLTGGLQQPVIDATVTGVGVTFPQVASLVTGLRYAKELDKPRGRVRDRMASERFDLEANLAVSFGKNLDRLAIDIPETTITVPSPLPGLAPDSSLTLPTDIDIQHQWKTQLGLRLGGDYNVIPNRFALRAGYSYESDGISKGYHQLDFFPFQRHGLHVGATVRVADLIDISASYAYFLTPDIDTSIDQAALRRNISGDTREGDATLVNAGRITQDASALIIEVGMHL